MCENLDEELNPPDALPASSHETGPSDPLLAHGQQWETLQGGVTECQRAKDGWRYAETRIRWQGALAETVWHDEEACFNHMMPNDFWMDCLQCCCIFRTRALDVFGCAVCKNTASNWKNQGPLVN